MKTYLTKKQRIEIGIRCIKGEKFKFIAQSLNDQNKNNYTKSHNVKYYYKKFLLSGTILNISETQRSLKKISGSKIVELNPLSTVRELSTSTGKIRTHFIQKGTFYSFFCYQVFRKAQFIVY